MALTRIVLRVPVFEAQRTNGRYLSDVLAGLCPMEVPRIAGQNDDAAGWICLDVIAVESIAEADVEHARHDRVDPVLRMPVRHQFCAAGRLHPDDIRAGFGGMADDDGKTHRRRKRRKGLPVDVFRQDRSENRLAWLMRACHASLPFRHLQRYRKRSTHTGCFNTLASTGILRRRLPVAVKIAFATAGTITCRGHARLNASGTGGRCGPSPSRLHGTRARNLRG